MVALLLAPILLAGAGALAALASRRIASVLYSASSILMLLLGVAGSLGLLNLAALLEVRLAPWLPCWSVHLSAGWLGAGFLVAAGLSLLVSSLYMYRDEGLPRLASASLGLGIAGTYLMILARDALTLITAWEMLSFATAIMVAAGGDKRSGLLYLILMHVVSLPMIAGIAYMIGAGMAWFDSVPRDILPLLAAALLAAYTTKAGLPPLGFWVPPVYSSLRGSSGGLLVASELPPLYQAAVLLAYTKPAAVVAAVYVQSMAAVGVGIAGGLWAGHARRLLGYTTVEYSGFAWLLLALYCSTGLALLLAGLIVLVVAHAAYKAGLLASAWDLAKTSGDKLSSALGLCRTPNTACRLASIASASALPIPPFAASIGELMLVYSLAIIARSYPPLPWTYAALLAAVILVPVTGAVYTRVASALLADEGEHPSSPLPDYLIVAVLLSSPLLAAIAAARMTPGLVNWLILYAVLAAGLAAARAVKPPRTRIWLSGETLYSSGVSPAAIGIASPSPRIGVERVVYKLRMPRLREATYAPLYYAVARRLAGFSRRVMKIHNGRLHAYLALLLAYMLLLFIVALWVVLYA